MPESLIYLRPRPSVAALRTCRSGSLPSPPSSVVRRRSVRPSDITMEGAKGRRRACLAVRPSVRPLFISGRFVNAVVISHAADLLDTTSQSHTPLEGRDGRTLRVWAQKKISQPVNNAIPSFQMGRPPAVNHHCSGIIRDKCVKVRQQTDDATRHVLKLH